jgi:hypothetical protein
MIKTKPLDKIKTNVFAKKHIKSDRPPLKTFEEEFYMDMYTFKMCPVPADYKKKCATEWVVMARDEEVLFLDEYRIKKGIPKTTFDRWIASCVELQEAKEFVRDIIAMRREEGALKNKYNVGMVMRIQHMYCDNWKKSEEWRAALRTKQEGVSNPQRIQVVLEPYPDSPLVPSKSQS